MSIQPPAAQQQDQAHMNDVVAVADRLARIEVTITELRAILGPHFRQAPYLTSGEAARTLVAAEARRR